MSGPNSFLGLALFFQSSGQATMAGIAKMLREPNIMEKLHLELVATGTHWVYGPELSDQPNRNVRKALDWAKKHYV